MADGRDVRDTVNVKVENSKVATPKRVNISPSNSIEQQKVVDREETAHLVSSPSTLRRSNRDKKKTVFFHDIM